MASIQKVRKKDGITVFRVQVCVNGVRDSGSFYSRQEARLWALQREAEILAQPLSEVSPISPVAAQSPVLTLGHILQRYKQEVSPTKAGRRWEGIRLDKLCTHPVADISITELGPEHFAAWRDQRLKQVSTSSARREMTLLSHALEVARREWRLIALNPLRDVKRPADAPHRRQRITEEDRQKLMVALGYELGTVPANKSQEIAVCLLLALETACRSGELLNLTREHIHLSENYIHLPFTKNGTSRDVPLSPNAVELLRLLLQRPIRASGRVFSVDASVRDTLFRRAKKKAGISHIHFHDSRREATTRLSEVFNPLELSRITGHKDLKQLLTYYEKPASELALKMAEKPL